MAFSRVPRTKAPWVWLAWLPMAAVLPSPLNWDAASPPPHALRRANWIQRQSRQLGGRHYLDRMETGKPLPDWLTVRYWRNRLEI